MSVSVAFLTVYVLNLLNVFQENTDLPITTESLWIYIQNNPNIEPQHKLQDSF